MTRRIKLEEVLEIHESILEQSGGSRGVRDLGALKSAIAQPFHSFGGSENFPTLLDKAGAYGFFIAKNHPFLDGNKRTAHATMEVFLNLNGLKIEADVDSQEELMISLAAGDISHDELVEWLKDHTTKQLS